MACKDKFDFNCPQYVDFLAGIDSNPEDIYFDCSDNFSPLDGRACKNLTVPVKGLTEEAENKLINKMTTALSVIENTPKLKTDVFRGKLFSEKAPGKDIGSQRVKPVMKSSTVHRPSVRMRSKSVCVVNKVNIDKPVKAKDFRPKRSSSLNDLRTIKKHTYPKTPLCLKRTINAKHKICKTTEEMELDQIAELRKQVTQLLRNNEISFKKLKLRQKPCVQKNTENKPENPKGNAGTNIDKNARRNFHALSHAAMKRETMKLESVMNKKESSNKAPKNICKDILEKSKNPSVSSSILSEDCENKEHVTKKHINVKYGFHSGIVFHDIVKKNTVVTPFHFEAKFKEMKDKKAEMSLIKSESKGNLNSGKENIPITKSKSAVKKPSGVQNMRSDMKLLGSKKIIRQHNGNPVRGLSLAENTFRN